MQFLGLLFSLIVVHVLYTSIVRPQAEIVLAPPQEQVAESPETDLTPQRSIWVIIKDYEQQICFTLFLWAMIMIVHKLYLVWRERRGLWENLVDIEKGERVIPQEALIHAKDLETRLVKTPNLLGNLLPGVILSALKRFHSTHSIQEASQSIRELSESESERMDSALSLIRYIAWAIPSVGFIGTVRGIGEALTKAEQAIEGDIQGVTLSLGLAFNSTLIALFLSIILMYFVHLLQSRQESLILEIEDYCRENLISVMKIPFKEESEASL